MASFSEILIRERNKKGLSKADMARKLNIPYTTYQNYENGREPKIEVIKSIAEELDIDPSVFFDLDSYDIYDHPYHPSSHSEVKDILLYDSRKFFKMKDNFNKYHHDIGERYFNIHILLGDFRSELLKFREDYFVSCDEGKVQDYYIKLYDIVERSNDDAEYHYQETIYESQFMDKTTIAQFKKNNPDYKIQIIKKVLLDNQDFDLDVNDTKLINTLYQIALLKYFPNK